MTDTTPPKPRPTYRRDYPERGIRAGDPYPTHISEANRCQAVHVYPVTGSRNRCYRRHQTRHPARLDLLVCTHCAQNPDPAHFNEGPNLLLRTFREAYTDDPSHFLTVQALLDHVNPRLPALARLTLQRAGRLLAFEAESLVRHGRRGYEGYRLPDAPDPA